MADAGQHLHSPSPFGAPVVEGVALLLPSFVGEGSQVGVIISNVVPAFRRRGCGKCRDEEPRRILTGASIVERAVALPANWWRKGSCHSNRLSLCPPPVCTRGHVIAKRAGLQAQILGVLLYQSTNRFFVCRAGCSISAYAAGCCSHKARGAINPPVSHRNASPAKTRRTLSFSDVDDSPSLPLEDLHHQPIKPIEINRNAIFRKKV